MNKKIVFLRGINVSGQKKILMKELQVLLVSGGFYEVVTYIQSGNLVVSSDQSLKETENLIHQLIKDHYAFDVDVLAVTPVYLKQILADSPFPEENLKEGERLYFTFLGDVPSEDRKAKLDSFKSDVDEMILSEKVVYIHIRGSYGNTLFSNNFIESKLKVTATTRNLETVKKMIALSGE